MIYNNFIKSDCSLTNVVDILSDVCVNGEISIDSNNGKIMKFVNRVGLSDAIGKCFCVYFKPHGSDMNLMFNGSGCKSGGLFLSNVSFFGTDVKVEGDIFYNCDVSISRSFTLVNSSITFLKSKKREEYVVPANCSLFMLNWSLVSMTDYPRYFKVWKRTLMDSESGSYEDQTEIFNEQIVDYYVKRVGCESYKTFVQISPSDETRTFIIEKSL